MQKLWIEVNGMQITSVHPFSSLRKNDKKKQVLITLKLGNAFSIGGIIITGKDGEGSQWFSQNWATMSGVRFLDVPILHQKKRKSKLLLRDVIGKALYLFCTEGDGQVLREFIQNGGEEPKLPFFKPEEWKGSLRIPVEFIKVRPSRCLDEKVYAYIQIGHHLMLWSVLICEKSEIKLYGNRILDPRLIAIIEQILAKEDLREEISYAYNNGRTYINTGTEFIEAITGCNTEKTPPAIRFY